MKKIFLLLIIFVIVFSSGCIFDKYPEIITDASDTSVKTVNIDFPFMNTRVTGEIEVNLAPYHGAVASEKNAILYGQDKDTAWEEKYYNAMTNDPALDNLYNSLISFFDKYAAEHSLNTDEYAEMVTSFVQTIPYKTEEKNTRFPIETIIDNYGDCDDKSVLFAGILSRKGYDVALFNFRNHMTAAISEGDSYVRVETTRYAYIGEKTDLSEFGVVTDSPDIYKIGSGSLIYSSGDMVNTVLEASDRISKECEDLYKKMNSLKEVIESQEKSLKNRFNAEEHRIYSANVDTYNSYVEEYYKMIKVLKKITGEQYNLEEVYNAVISMT